MALAWGAVLGVASASRADELGATRGQPLSETAHLVEVSLRDGIATYRVRRSFHNAGRVADEARLSIALPHGAVATGLRIKSGQRWYAGDLMHADKAEELYRELTGLGPSRPKDPALLYWQWTDQLELRVFPVFPGKTSTVEYTLTAPTTYEGGTYYVSYGRKPEVDNLATPIVTLRADRLRAVELDGEPVGTRRLALSRLEPHPVLVEHMIDDPRVLVRALEVDSDASAGQVELHVDIRHTWPGDLQLDLIEPGGSVTRVLDHDFSRNDNDLRRSFTVAHAGPVRGTWYLLVKDHHPLDGGTLRSWSLAPLRDAAEARPGQTPDRRAPGELFVDRRPAFIPQPSDDESQVATIGMTLSGVETQLRLGRVALLGDKQFSRVEVDVAQRLSRLPRGLWVVFVVDASHTMGSDGIAAQLRLARAYLSHLPDARFALVGFRRDAELWADFAPASAFDRTVSALRAAGGLAPHNGSFLDRGIALGARLLEGAGGPSALIAMTDDRLRPVWSNDLALSEIARLSEHTIVHVADVYSGSAGSAVTIERSDDHRLFPLAQARAGVAVDAFGALDGKWSQLQKQTLYLVRPTRIDHPSLALPEGQGRGIDGQALFEGPLEEGASVRWMAQVEVAPAMLALHGQLWSREVSFASVGDEPFHRATAGFVFSLDHYSDLSDAEQFVIADYARAVSPVTSYLAIEPGVRPSQIGFESTGHGLGLGGVGAGGFGSLGVHLAKVSWSRIRDAVDSACDAQRKDGEDAKVIVDLNDHEIADVRLDGAQTPFARCAVEALWGYELPVATYGDISRELVL